MTSQTSTPKLVSLVALDGRDEGELLVLAAGATDGIDGRLAAAIRESVRDRNAEVSGVSEGVLVGTPASFSELGI